MIGRAIKFVKTFVKWTFRLIVLGVIIAVLVYAFNFVVNTVSAQAGSKCKEISAQVPGGKVLVYKELAEWLKTQSTSLVSVDDAYYEKGKNGDQVVIKYSTLNNWYHGKKVIDQETLEKYCQ